MDLMPAVRALHLAALALLAGGFAFPLLVLPVSAAAEPERALLRGWLARLRLWGALLALVTWLAWLVLVAVEMSGLPLVPAMNPSVLGLVVGSTRFGHVWLIRIVLVVLFLAWLPFARRAGTGDRSASEAVGSVLAALVLVSQVWAGHATAGPPLHVLADALHLAAAALWVGTLPPLLAVFARARAAAPPWSALALAAARRFTALGVVAVVALAVTGFINGRMMVGSVQALATTDYGRLVAAKVVLFAAMLAVAAANRFRLTPRLQEDTPAAARALFRNVSLEIAMGACIFALVGLLGGSQPPAHEPPGGDEPMHHSMGMEHEHGMAD